MARLTKEQREALDIVLETILTNTYVNNNRSFNMRELFTVTNRNFDNDDLTQANVQCAYGRLLKKHSEWQEVMRWGYTSLCTPNVIIMDYTIRKDRNLLYFSCDESYTQLTYDFINKTFNVEIDRTVLDREGVLEIFNRAKDYEWLFNYCLSLRDINEIISTLSTEYYSTMPKGLYQYLTEHREELTCEILEEYIITNRYGKNAYAFKETLDNNAQFKYAIENIGIDNINKMIINDVRNINYYSYNSIRDMIKNLIRCCQDCTPLFTKPTLEYLDLNRGIEYNVNRLKELRDKERNELLAKNLQRLNFINGLEIDNYVVVVPQTQAEKKEEGKMQNNCVGYYYDDSIIDGRNLIYFLRRKAEPQKSYITCRYNIPDKATVEYRFKNNLSVRDNNLVTIIKQISSIIREQLV